MKHPDKIIGMIREIGSKDGCKEEKHSHSGSKPIFPFYEVKFEIEGQIRKVVVDDRFPPYVIERFDASTQSKRDTRKYFWAAVIEKAFAKLFGGYANLEGGYPKHAMMIILGCYCEEIAIPDNPTDRRKKMIKEYIEDPDIIVTASRKIQIGKKVEGHVYGIYKHISVDANDGKVTLYLYEPNGELCYSKNNCTLGKGKQVENIRGKIEMSFEDFLNDFFTITIGKLNYKQVFSTKCDMECNTGYELTAVGEPKHTLVVGYHGRFEDCIRKKHVSGCSCKSERCSKSLVQYAKIQYAEAVNLPIEKLSLSPYADRPRYQYTLLMEV